MHDTAMEIGCLVMDRYSDLPKAKVLELGSYDVNGSLRSHAPETTEYVGLDLEAGPGVDFVVEPGKPWPVEDNYFDLVLASSVFEHDPMFWVTFLEMIKKVRTGGYIYISAPSNGSVHRYPEDHWRFYPDSGLALMRWAQSQGFPVQLVESFTAGRKGDQWNDFVAIFRKGRAKKGLPKSFVYQNVNCLNVITWNSDGLMQESSKTEDMIIIDESREKLGGLENQLDVLKAENQKNWDERQQFYNQALLYEGRLNQEQESHQVTRDQLVELSANLEQHKSSLAAAEVRLAQFQELVASLGAARDELKIQLEQQLCAVEAALSRATEGDVRISELEALSSTLQVENAELSRALASAEDVRNRLAVAESTLLQRQEEIEQTRAELVGLRAVYSALSEERDSLAARLRDADSWVFKLASERKEREIEAQRANARLVRVEREARAEISTLSHKLHQLRLERDRLGEQAEAYADEIGSLADQLSSSQAALEEVNARLDRATVEREELLKVQKQAVDQERLEKESIQSAAREALSRLASAERERDAFSVQLQRANQQVAERSSEIATLTRLLSNASAHERLAQQASERLASTERERDALSRQLEQAKQEVAERSTEIATLTRLLSEASVHELIARDASEALASAHRDRDAAQAELADTMRQSSERLSEVVALTHVLSLTQSEIEVRQKRVDCLRDIARAMQHSPRWWSLLPKKNRRKRELQRLRRQGLFDAESYLSRYPDVAEAGMDPLDHFIIHGIDENRTI